MINIDNIPPPATVNALLVEAIPTFNGSVISFSMVMDVMWVTSSSNSSSLPGRLGKRAAVQAAQMQVTSYTVVVGVEEILEPYGAIPMSSIQRGIIVSALLQSVGD